MKKSKSLLSSLLVILVTLTLLQACSYEAVRLNEGAPFDEFSRYALVIFGVGTDPPVFGLETEDQTTRRTRFRKWDLETGKIDGFCLRKADSVLVPPPPYEAKGFTYMAFKVAKGSYIGSVNPERPRRFITVVFTVDVGQAYYVGNLIQYGEGLVRIETKFSDAASWLSSHLDVQVPLTLAPIKEYKGGRLRMCHLSL